MLVTCKIGITYNHGQIRLYRTHFPLKTKRETGVRVGKFFVVSPYFGLNSVDQIPVHPHVMGSLETLQVILALVWFLKLKLNFV